MTPQEIGLFLRAQPLSEDQRRETLARAKVAVDQVFDVLDTISASVPADLEAAVRLTVIATLGNVFENALADAPRLIGRPG